MRLVEGWSGAGGVAAPAKKMAWPKTTKRWEWEAAAAAAATNPTKRVEKQNRPVRRLMSVPLLRSEKRFDELMLASNKLLARGDNEPALGIGKMTTINNGR
jgi:hypothetical protein